MRALVLVAIGVVLAGCALDRRGVGASPDGAPSIPDASLDAGRVDAGEVDAGEVDAGEVDAGEVDGGDLDGGAPDAGGVDGGQDAGSDAGQDAGSDAGQDAGPPPVEGCDRRVLGGRTYLFCMPASDRAAARDRCQDAGMDLVVIGSGGENALLATEIGARGGAWYIGLADGDWGDEGDFEWVDGTTPGYTSWGDDQPDNDWDEDCVEMHGSGGWNDIDCGSDRSFVCEAP